MVEVSGYACITTALPSVSIHYSVLKKKCLSYSSTVNIPMITGASRQSEPAAAVWNVAPGGLTVSQSLSLSVLAVTGRVAWPGWWLHCSALVKCWWFSWGQVRCGLRTTRAASPHGPQWTSLCSPGLHFSSGGGGTGNIIKTRGWGGWRTSPSHSH